MPLINCVISLSLTWSKKCVIAHETTRYANPGANLPVLETRAPKKATLKITDTNTDQK